MSETVFAFNATSMSSDNYLGICRIPEGESIFGALQDALKDATGEEYAYLEAVDLYTDSTEHQGQVRSLTSELIRDFYRALELAEQ